MWARFCAVASESVTQLCVLACQRQIALGGVGMYAARKDDMLAEMLPASGYRSYGIPSREVTPSRSSHWKKNRNRHILAN